MKKFEVTISESQSRIISVLAEDEDSAQELAEEKYSKGNYKGDRVEFLGHELIDVREVPEFESNIGNEDLSFDLLLKALEIACFKRTDQNTTFTEDERAELIQYLKPYEIMEE